MFAERNERHGVQVNGTQRLFLVAVLTALGLIALAVLVSASTVAPQVVELHRTQLSTREKFAAYPDVDVGSGGLVAAAWTEGSDPLVEKHNGPLMLGWIVPGGKRWQTALVDGGKVYDAAVAVVGSTVHLVWSRDKTAILYTTCAPTSSPNCATPAVVATAAVEALQVDIVLDGGGVPHLVWVEQDDLVYYSRKQGGSWLPKQSLQAYAAGGSEGPSIAYARGYVHLVWTEWQDADHTYSVIKYCRRGTGDDDWSSCQDPLAQWFTDDLLARNPAVVADDAGNVYVVWDMVSNDDGGSNRQYAIGYVHSDQDGATDSWKGIHSYPDGDEFGRAESGSKIFRSGDESELVEYIQYLKPQIQLVVSGTTSVPLLTWHTQAQVGGSGEGLLQASARIPHKVYWTYATRPGSYAIPLVGTGFMHWATEPITLSKDLCGGVDMAVNSATARVAPVGDLRDILAGDDPQAQLHAVYHEEIGEQFWGAFYNNNHPFACFDVHMPIISRNANPGGGE
jgi:hypothetical protein